MDQILTSLTLYEPLTRTNASACERPDGLALTGFAMVDEPVPCLVWSTLSDNERGVRARLAYGGNVHPASVEVILAP